MVHPSSVLEGRRNVADGHFSHMRLLQTPPRHAACFDLWTLSKPKASKSFGDICLLQKYVFCKNMPGTVRAFARDITETPPRRLWIPYSWQLGIALFSYISSMNSRAPGSHLAGAKLDARRAALPLAGEQAQMSNICELVATASDRSRSPHCAREHAPAAAADAHYSGQRHPGPRHAGARGARD